MPVFVLRRWMFLLPWLCSLSGAGGLLGGELELRGVVLDPSGASIGGAVVQITGDGTSVTVIGEQDGSFTFSALSAGTYELSVSAEDFEPVEQSIELAITIQDHTVQLALAGGVHAVEVVASRPEAPQASESGQALEISQEDLQKLPVMDGDILAALQGWVDAGGFGDGGGGLVVDGMETGTLGVTASAIQEIRINKNAYSAEYSRPGRARIEVITKKGSEEVHGQISVRGRDHRLDARNAFASSRPEQRRLGVEGSVTGPIGSTGKNSYVVSAERDQDRSASIVFATTPTGVVREPVLTPENEVEFSARWDHHPTYERAFSLRYEFERESERNNGVGGFRLAEAGSDSREMEQRLYGSYRKILGATAILEWRGRIGHERGSERSRSADPRIIVLDAFTGGGGQRNREDTTTRAESSATSSFQRGSHTIRTGLLMREVARRRFDDRDNFGGTFRFASLGDFEAGRAFAFSARSGTSRLAYWDIEWAGFVQDDIRLNKRSTLAFGLRYDRNELQPDGNNLAPRASYAVGIGEERRTTVRAGGGIFYDAVGRGAYVDRVLFDGARLRDVVVANPTYPDAIGSGGVEALQPNLVRWQAALPTAYFGQYGVTVERRLNRSMTLSADWARTVGVGMYRSIDRNAPAGPSQTRPNATVGIIREIEPSGRLESNSLRTQLRGKIGGFFRGTVRYAWGRAYNDFDDDDDLPANSLDRSREWGPAGFDRRHRFDALGSMDVLDWFELGVVWEADSASPYTVTTGLDNNGDGTARDRPEGVARNTERGVMSSDVDVRLSKTFALDHVRAAGGEPTKLALTFDAFNVLNTVNLRGFVGNQNSPLFGQPTSASSARRLQAGMRWRF